MQLIQKYYGAYLPLALLALTAPLPAQIGSGYQGPGVLSRGAEGVGNRSGQQIDLRFSVGLNGFYDTGLVPLSLDSNGRLAQLGGLAGVEANASTMGSHSWRRAMLGVNYSGTYRYYPKSSYYSGSNQSLVVGYTFQKSRRLSFDLQMNGGTSQFGNSGFQNGGNLNGLDPNAALLFDNRMTFGGGGMHVNYLKSARTLFTAGGNAFTSRRQNQGLASMNGYTLDGAMQRQITRSTALGVTYSRSHYDYSRQFGETDLDTFQAFLTHRIGRSWSLSLQGGAYRAETQGLEQVALEPGIAALLGVSTGVRTFYRKVTSPLGQIAISRSFRQSFFSLNVGRTIAPGNGVYLTSFSDTAGFGYSYTGIRNWSLSLAANSMRMRSIGQQLGNYRSNGGSVGIARRLSDTLYLTGELAIRKQQLPGFNRLSTRYSLGFAYSPGSLPLSLW